MGERRQTSVSLLQLLFEPLGNYSCEGHRDICPVAVIPRKEIKLCEESFYLQQTKTFFELSCSLPLLTGDSRLARRYGYA